MPINDFDDYLVAILDAIVEGRIEAKTLRDFTPEQREQWKARIVAEEKDEIAEGLARHEAPSPNGEDVSIKED
jgi:hypothetical protein